MTPQEKMAALKKIVLRGAHLVRLNEAALDQARLLLDINPKLTVQDLLDRVDNLAHIEATRI